MATHNWIKAGALLALATSLAIGSAAWAQDTIAAAGAAEEHRGEIGNVEFGVSCAPAVRDRFDHALGLLHHMMYEQARAEFGAIAEADPDCAMAHWGVATTLFQPLWPERPDETDRERGWRAIERARELAPDDERERLLIEATAGFFREPSAAEYWQRIERWAEGMSEAHEANPDDLDTAALYGLSRLAIAQQADDRDPLHDEVEEILRDIWRQEQTHPGAIHYTIHSTDVDGRAENALDMVEAYAEIAPEVPHALHMPSHIYVRLGDWPAVIEWNRRSADAARDEQTDDGATSLHYIHALDYLVYGYLQQGRDGDARETLREARAVDRHQPSFAAAFHSAAMPARIAVEQRDWDEAIELEPRNPTYLPWNEAQWPEGLTWYARGLGGVHGDDLELAEEAEQRLAALRDEAEAEGETAFANYIEVDRRILAGWIAHAQGDADEAVRLMRSAGDLESRLEKHPITPGALLPPNEALGDLLLALERPTDALAAYERSDENWPGRFNTLLGAARAAEAAGDEAAAQAYYERLTAVAPDSAREAVREARDYD